jgi:hypothetical protein
VTRRMLFSLVLTTIPLTISSSALAADTTETYGLGASDYELYLGLDGVGLGDSEMTVWGQTLLGFGFAERFSGYIAMSAEGTERLSAGTGGAAFGIFGTPVDTSHFDLDLFLGAGFGDGEMFMTPALELNLDARPDLALCGLYVRAEEALAGRDDSIADDPVTTDADESEERNAFAATTVLTVGGYFTIAEIHQILLEYDMAFHPGGADLPAGGSEVVERGGVALGYNVRVTKSIELLAQVSADVPNDGEDLAAGFLVGLIATMPSPAD